ncbi:response regulator [Oscillochloris trichoides DG-6]|uniref:Response regulator n=1 Tax=Oscillochloris trichoides DG-6 TaxID=765420 RepID=E1IBS3_9CHLR|nr:sensor domain-containing diguanylate cyclase [Oscillochloris trichoides]EFO81375.1 response regulator [Oscillochloris trichoides DG-6]
MYESVERLIMLGARLLIEQTSALVALLDAEGGVMEANPRLRQILAAHPELHSILDLLEPNSRRRFHTLLTSAQTGNPAGPVTLNVSETPTAIPQSYRAILTLVAPGQYIFFAELIAPLDQLAAEEYIQITSQLATATRSLQKTSHELAKKQHELEEALATSEHIARTDDLTGLLNRRSIMLILGNEADRVRRYQSQLSILMIDIDHFKQVNDRYGHLMGDQVLRECAGLLRRSIRAIDHLGRYGGEEFLCILPMTSEGAAVDLAERLNRDIAHLRFFANELVSFNVTISVGVSEMRMDQDTPDRLLARADAALYAAKAKGRNCVVVGN